MANARVAFPFPFSVLVATYAPQLKIGLLGPSMLATIVLVVFPNDEMKPYEVRRHYSTPAIWDAYPFPATVINSLRLGIPSYFVRLFEGSLVNKIYKYNITEIVLVPHVLCSILDQCSKNLKPIELQSLQTVSSAGAPLAPALRERFLARFDVPPRIVQVWGLTECGWLSTYKYPESDDTGSVGRMLLGCEIRTCNQDDNKDGSDKGELCVRGSQLMMGYRGDEEAAARAIRPDGWFHTGDIGYSKDGKVYIVGRIKDIIKVDGFVVSPTELEDTLYQCPGVSDCAAFGKGYGVDEHPVLSVVAANDDLSVDRIRKHMHSNLSSYKADKCEVHFVESIPRNRGGKILHDKLKQEV
jgi:acyl-CoA synthetase (AMP-forming)/AMP-acid ligase II